MWLDGRWTRARKLGNTYSHKLGNAYSCQYLSNWPNDFGYWLQRGERLRDLLSYGYAADQTSIKEKGLLLYTENSVAVPLSATCLPLLSLTKSMHLG